MRKRISILIASIAVFCIGVGGLLRDALGEEAVFQVKVVKADFTGWENVCVEVRTANGTLVTAGRTNLEGDVFFNLPVGGPYNLRAGNARTTASVPSVPSPALVGVVLMPTLVNYGFKGLFPPYAGPPKTFNSGSTIPLKWQYTDPLGNPIDSPTANPEVVVKSPNGVSIGAVSPGFSTYQYDPLTKTWQFNWSTKGLSAGIYQIYIKSRETGQEDGPFPILLR
jgi:hypothetical protein